MRGSDGGLELDQAAVDNQVAVGAAQLGAAFSRNLRLAVRSFRVTALRAAGTWRYRAWRHGCGPATLGSFTTLPHPREPWRVGRAGCAPEGRRQRIQIAHARKRVHSGGTDPSE